MTRHAPAVLLAMALLTPSAGAQYRGYAAATTPEGDYLRGIGFAAYGMGSYNLATAQANSINVNTEIRWNEYVWSVIKQTNRENAEERARVLAKHRAAYADMLRRIRENPEARDVMTGDALNAVMEKLNDPSIDEQVMRYASQVPLPVDVVRAIPFRINADGMKFSMQRLTAKGKKAWPVAFQDPRFAAERRAYERALDVALEQQIEGKMSMDAIAAVAVAVADLRKALDREVRPGADKLYLESRRRVSDLEASVTLLKSHKAELALGDLDRYPGVNVGDLVVYMRKHKLAFGSADTPDERRLYPELYAALNHQAELLNARTREPKNDPRP